MESYLRWGYKEAFCWKVLKHLRQIVSHKGANRFLDNRLCVHVTWGSWFFKTKIHIKSQPIIGKGI